MFNELVTYNYTISNICLTNYYTFESQFLKYFQELGILNRII